MPEVSELDGFDSAEEEIKEMTQVLLKEKSPTESVASARAGAVMSPLLDQNPYQQVFFIDDEQFLAHSKEE